MSHVDEHGRAMDDPVTVTLPRATWYLIRNQLRNQADYWQKLAPNIDMANKTNAAANRIDAQVIDSSEQPPFRIDIETDIQVPEGEIWIVAERRLADQVYGRKILGKIVGIGDPR